MKKLLLFMALLIGLSACASNDNTAKAKSPGRDRVEVIYFFGKQRCATCRAIELNTKDVLNKFFSKEMKSGKVVFKCIDMSTPEGETLADKYEVSFSSLFVNRWKAGKETRNNMTEFAFGNARKNPDAFKKTLADKIRQSLK